MNLFVSLIRTGVPALAGWLVALAAKYGLGLDPAALSGLLTAVVGFVYFAVFRVAEEHLSSKFGWLLGYARPPKYDTGKAQLPDTR
ncbi:hypothetical protein AB0K51_09455 [Kitasatospora sp. NPDC049285]|uniref:hypothetical protein n=1 Tax=Kitasatospora sp. NPDC049285 TaxID=3157096 RepID=UPI00344703A3